MFTGPAADGWETLHTEEGAAYYYCAATGETRWDAPTQAAPAEAAAAAAAGGEAEKKEEKDEGFLGDVMRSFSGMTKAAAPHPPRTLPAPPPTGPPLGCAALRR